MSCPVSPQALPCGAFLELFTSEDMRGRNSVNSHTPLSFPKSRSALWDNSPVGEMRRLQLSSHRKPGLLLLEKALRLAHRHARRSNKPRLHCFFLGSVSVDADEEGVTITLDRFDPGRDQAGASGRVPSALLPGDVLVPCLFSTQTETTSDTVVQSEADLHQCFKVLQRFVSSRQNLDLSQLLKVRGRVICAQQSDVVAFSLNWSVVCPSVNVDIQPVRPIPIIPTALLRSLTDVGRPPQHNGGRQRGFLTMDQTRKLLLLLESDPKACSLPLVGLWLSGVTHVYNPQVWACCLRFMFSSTLQDRVLSESGSFLLVVFASTHRAPQFFQCQGPRPGPGPGPASQLDYQLLTASQMVTLHQVAQADSRTLQVELGSEDHSRQMEVFREAQISFSSAPPPTAGLSVSDQDSGVEDEDLSPRPSPSPHPPAQQARRVQPSVPELSLLIDTSFSSSHNSGQDPSSAHKPPVDRKPAPPSGASSAAPRPPPHLHSTPNSNPHQSCTCCSAHPHNCTSIFPSHHSTPPPSTHNPAPPSPSSCPVPPVAPASTSQSVSPSFTHHTPFPSHHHTSPPPSSNHPIAPSFNAPTHSHTSPPSTLVLPPAPSFASSHPVSPPWPSRPSCMNQCCHQAGGIIPSDTYQLLLHQDHQLRLLQAQVQMLLETQKKLQSSSQQVNTRTASIAVETGASLFWGDPVQPVSHQEVQASPPSSPKPHPSSSSSPSASSHDLSALRPVGGAEDGNIRGQAAPCSPSGLQSISGLQSPVLGESVSMYRPADDQETFYHNLMTQLTSRLQESDCKQEVERESRRTRLSVGSDFSQSSSLSIRKQQSPAEDFVVGATLRQLQQLGVKMDEEDLTECGQIQRQAVESASTLASISPAAVLSRLSVSEPTASTLFPGGSVDLSLEANAIALRYLSDSQLSRLPLGGHAPCSGSGPSSTGDSLLSPSNMSLATRKYMRRYGLLEEEDGDDEEKQQEVGVTVTPARQPLAEAVNIKLLPQSQLIRDLRPKMQLLSSNPEANVSNKENRSSRRSSLVRAGSGQTEGSVGNILDLSRLRQLPKLF